jgi:hypothetical protein
MTTHRASYLKTALAALTGGAALLALAGYMAIGDRHVPIVRWSSTVVFVVLGLFAMLVATGGFFALHEDAKESQADRSLPGAR